MSANPSVSIPIRSSSKQAIAPRSLVLKQSRQELKRKLSTISHKDSPIEFTRLKLEDARAEKEEELLHKEWIDEEKDNFSDNDFRKAHREVNKRIISLGDTLWKHAKELRRLEEKHGLVPQLGPDSKGAYVSTLLSLYKDPRKTGKRSSSLQSNMRAAAIEVYDVEKDAPAGRLWCAISGSYFQKKYMKAAHIVPHRIGPDAVDYIFEKGAGARLNTADNCLMMHNTVENEFDNGSFVLLPVDAAEKPIKRWKIQITNLAAINSDLGHETIKSLNGKEIQFKNENRPAARFLYFHFVITLLRNKRDRSAGWDKYLSELPSGKPFATMGPYLRKSMLLVLAKTVGDLSDEEETKLLGEKDVELFDEESKLSEPEEEEIVRRVIEVTEEQSDVETVDLVEDDGDESVSLLQVK